MFGVSGHTGDVFHIIIDLPQSCSLTISIRSGSFVRTFVWTSIPLRREVGGGNISASVFVRGYLVESVYMPFDMICVLYSKSREALGHMCKRKVFTKVDCRTEAEIHLK